MDIKIVEILKELENIASDTAPFWNVPSTTGKFLHLLVRLTRAQRVLEIGTSNGYSGMYLAEALSHNGGLLYTVESHKERFALAKNNFEKSGLTPFIRQVFGHAPEIFPELHEQWDMVFLDATKMEYKSYIEGLLENVKPGGLIVADNAISHDQEMQNYLNFVNESPHLENVLLGFDKGVMVSLKKS